MNTCKSDTRCWVLMLGVLIALGMFLHTVSAPIVSVRPSNSTASHIQLKVTQQFATHFKTAKKIKIWFN
ncbi:MAG: hypothetical protein LW863_13860 [Flammeovirgaceae bacterium]|nr:hypothetical protein [Flammeovirgaceae bacterium]